MALVVVVRHVAAARVDGLTMTDDNPYRWNGQNPRVHVPRKELVDQVVAHLTRGEGVTLLAGRGLGKSVLLLHVEQALRAPGSATVARFPGPPTTRTLSGCLAEIARSLAVPFEEGLAAIDLVCRHLDANPTCRSVCLLYDEVDQYATRFEGEPLSRLLFNHLEVARKELDGQLALIVAGGLGMFHLRSVDASPFISRAARERLRPFDAQQLALLAVPFVERHSGLSEDFLPALAALSGGNPALATYALQMLWSESSPDAQSLSETFARFHEKHSDFLWSFRKGVLNEQLSEAPQRVLDLVRRSDGPISLRALTEACRVGVRDPDLAPLDPHDVVDLLECAGLIRREGTLRRDPVRLRAVATMLSLSETPRTASTLREQLLGDLACVLADLHSMSVDFFRYPTKNAKELVPESVFSAFVTLGLRLLGWSHVEREAILGAGRTDIKARHDGFPEQIAVVEVKIWGRPRYDGVHAQVLGYWSAQVVAAAVVMIADGEVDDWPDTYRAKCLGGVGTVVEDLPCEHPVRGIIRARSRTPDGADACVDHHLLRLPHR